jgi:hypothetical protein
MGIIVWELFSDLSPYEERRSVCMLAEAVIGGLRCVLCGARTTTAFPLPLCVA